MSLSELLALCEKAITGEANDAHALYEALSPEVVAALVTVAMAAETHSAHADSNELEIVRALADLTAALERKP